MYKSYKLRLQFFHQNWFIWNHAFLLTCKTSESIHANTFHNLANKWYQHSCFLLKQILTPLFNHCLVSILNYLQNLRPMKCKNHAKLSSNNLKNMELMWRILRNKFLLYFYASKHSNRAVPFPTYSWCVEWRESEQSANEDANQNKETESSSARWLSPRNKRKK